jgi:hypothetical protein
MTQQTETVDEVSAAPAEPMAWMLRSPTRKAIDGSIVKRLPEQDLKDVQIIPLYAAPPARPTDDELWDKTLSERDDYIDWADRLSEAIGKHLGIDIGEHSSAHNPWQAALDALESAPTAPIPSNSTELNAAPIPPDSRELNAAIIDRGEEGGAA